jgi:hypothetical protein
MVSEYDDTDGGVPWFVVAAVIILLALAVWLTVGLLFTTFRFAFAIAGYIVVAFLAYQVGKWVGRNSAREEP